LAKKEPTVDSGLRLCLDLIKMTKFLWLLEHIPIAECDQTQYTKRS